MASISLIFTCDACFPNLGVRVFFLPLHDLGRGGGCVFLEQMSPELFACTELVAMYDHKFEVFYFFYLDQLLDF